MKITFEKATLNDLVAIKEIYDYYITKTTATFHTHPISFEELREMIPFYDKKYPSFMVKADEYTAGYCYLAPFKKRQAYNRSAEATVYLKPDFCGKGIGFKTVTFLEETAKKIGFKVLLGTITGTNENSIRLFAKCGFEKCAHFKQVGQKFDEILDVVVYQKILE
ncbi:GNAT family N-acetyltransferase [Thermophagus xiamenensis]|uniref:Phosphinothricin acetyltransferase n=1 Tax=Thermophagus xiamenensis TaxID=385682 RepID=A0A1I1XPT2_9BACT|nr:GNAT family N-acetyltransferase [Thermophagus xiamenensis]SFE07590.1 phosphinothricin acetyltransferase [Thermophagus xiamenensis]